MNHDNRIYFKHYSQNELVNQKTIRSLINQSSISEGDLVYDIGAGSGNITGALLERGARVIGIEKDRKLYLKCQQRFSNRENVSICHADFLQWEFPPDHMYKVFSNIPFVRTAGIVNRLVFNKNPPEDAYLIIQKEAAEKYAGVPRDTLVSLLIKPLFWVDIIYHFKRHDFFPVPSVDIVLIQFEKRKCRLVSEADYGLYKDFIVFCREGRSRTITGALKNIFRYSRLKHVMRLLRIDGHASPGALNFMQYLSIFQFYLGYDLSNLTAIQGAEARLLQQQAKRKRIHRTIRKRRDR